MFDRFTVFVKGFIHKIFSRDSGMSDTFMKSVGSKLLIGLPSEISQH